MLIKNTLVCKVLPAEVMLRDGYRLGGWRQVGCGGIITF